MRFTNASGKATTPAVTPPNTSPRKFDVSKIFISKLLLRFTLRQMNYEQYSNERVCVTLTNGNKLVVGFLVRMNFTRSNVVHPAMEFEISFRDPEGNGRVGSQML
jgi:hypothetical protein